MTATHAKEDEEATHLIILDEEFFKQAITRERKRTERSGMAMVLLLIGLPNRSSEQGMAHTVVVANALSAIMPEFAILGWFEPPSVIGLIVPEVEPAALPSTCERLNRTFLSVIRLQGDGELAQDLSVRLLVYPEATASDETQVSPMQPRLYPELLGNVSVTTNFQTLKRGMDIVVSALLLILLLPVFAFIVVLVKLSSTGPVFSSKHGLGI